MNQIITRNNEVVVEAQIHLVFVNKDGKPKKIPDFNARIRSNLVANTIHEKINELSRNLSENLFPEVQHNNNQTFMKDKLQEILTIFGLSLTSINLVISILFIITLIKIFNNYEKNK